MDSRIYIALKPDLPDNILEQYAEQIKHLPNFPFHTYSHIDDRAPHGIPIEYFQPTPKIYEDTQHPGNFISTIARDIAILTFPFDDCDLEAYPNEDYTPDMQIYRPISLRHEDIPEYMYDREFTITFDANSMYTSQILLPNNTRIAPELFELASLPDNREDAIVWSNSLHTSIRVDSSRIIEQLRVRYAFFERPRAGLLNIVMDSFMPQLLYSAKFSMYNLGRIANPPKTAVAISPWFASMLDVKQVPISDLLAILGYTPTYIRTLFKRVRIKKLHLAMVGYGGTSINTITWLTEMAKLINAPQLFNKITIFEPDTIEVSNLLRFPLDPRQCLKEYRADQQASKIDLISGANKLSKTVIKRETYFNDAQGYWEGIYSRKLDIDGNNVYSSKPNTVAYGAPDIDTRATLSKIGNFISATHSDQSCRIDLNPAQNTSLQVESYGVISLATFFMNQLQMSISFLELLASDQDLQEQDKTILEYTFDGVTKLPKECSRSYNFQLNHTGRVLTPEEAAANV